MSERILGRYTDDKTGPLLICIGGMHGNEPAGVLAMEEVLRLLEKEKEVFPSFAYRGTFVCIRGNLKAIAQKKRFIRQDLNRMLREETIQHLRQQDPAHLQDEDSECLDLVDTIFTEIKQAQPSLTLILDLHTTTATGGLFTIANEDAISLSLAKGLHVPVLLGITSGLSGTTINYFHKPAEETYCLVFEAGQHDAPSSVNRTVSVIINCMRSLSAVDSIHVDPSHDGFLIDLATGLPKVTRLAYHYKISPVENFIMKKGFMNFDAVKKGDLLAENENGPIYSPEDGFILMPKYQALGDDGFFIVKEVPSPKISH